jgi:hypothetical protein
VIGEGTEKFRREVPAETSWDGALAERREERYESFVRAG